MEFMFSSGGICLQQLSPSNDREVSIVYTKVPKHALDLVKLPKMVEYSIPTKHIAEHWQSTTKEVNAKIEKANAKYKETANKRRKHQLFEVGIR